MRTLFVSIMMALIVFPIINASESGCHENRGDSDREITICGVFDGYSFSHKDDVRLNIDGDDVVITCERRRYRSDEVKITRNYDLYINGEKVDVNKEQRRLLKDYYNRALDVDREARIIAEEGTKIGLEGARIGVKAASGALKLLFLDFDEDEFEEKIERAAEELEERADRLEERADKLEELADELEEIQEDLSDKIPELEKLRWF